MTEVTDICLLESFSPSFVPDPRRSLACLHESSDLREEDERGQSGDSFGPHAPVENDDEDD
jgi:hypothetical protein